MSILKAGITLYLVRHGETDWNREARYQGQRDIPLNDTGRAQASRHGAVLNTVAPPVLDFDFVSSPLLRAKQTMRLIREELGLDPDDFQLNGELAELNYGHWEGQLATDLPASDPAGVAGKANDPFGWRPDGGESYRDLSVRVERWLRTLDRDTVVATHGGVSRVARGALFSIEERRIPFLECPQDRILKLTHETMSWV